MSWPRNADCGDGQLSRVLIDRRTGIEVGPRVPVEKQDWPFKSIAPSEPLWRYLDYWKFRDMLETSSLWFARQDRFRDPFEGRLAPANDAGHSRSDQHFREAYRVNSTLQQVKEQYEIQRHCFFISCWHRNTKESWQMWQAYTESPESVVVVSSGRALDRCVPESVQKSAVRYHGRNYRRTDFGGMSMSLFKPSELAFEREFRLLLPITEGESVDYDNPADYGRPVKVPLKRIIHRVVTHPQATGCIKGRVDELLRAHCGRIQREDSALRA